MMAEFSDRAFWMGRPLAEMSREDFRRALLYKTTELRYCYAVMTAAQTQDVAVRMESVPVPVPAGDQ